MKGTGNDRVNVVLQQAAVSVNQALETWNSADLGRVGGSQELLERAVLELRQAAGALAQDPPPDAAKLRPLLTGLQRDVARLSHLVDAGSAFQRGLAARLGDPGVAYDSDGRIPDSGKSSKGIEA